jgi:hypothetical protein
VTDKSLGQVASDAYEAATKERRDGFVMSWDALSSYGRAGWQAAADAVAAEVRMKDDLCDDYPKCDHDELQALGCLREP